MNRRKPDPKAPLGEVWSPYGRGGAWPPKVVRKVVGDDFEARPPEPLPAELDELDETRLGGCGAMAAVLLAFGALLGLGLFLAIVSLVQTCLRIGGAS